MSILDNILNKMNKILHPNLAKEIEISTTDEEVIQKLTTYFAKLLPFIDIFIKKEIAIDKLLTEWNQTRFNDLKIILNELETTITSEWGNLEKFENETKNTAETLSGVTKTFLYSDSTRLTRWELRGNKAINLDTIKRLGTDLFFLETTYKLQLELVSKIEKLSDDERVKIIIFKLVKTIRDEFNALSTIFGLESEYIQDFEKLVQSPIADLADAPSKVIEKEKEILSTFIQKCTEFIIKNKVHMILVTESSARILGIILLDQLRKRKINDVVVASVNPNALNFVEVFSQQRKALATRIIKKKELPILIVDEYSGGNTLNMVKKYFETLGAKIVYTASCFRGDPNKINIVGGDFREPSWYGKHLLQRFKQIQKPNTRPVNRFVRIEKHPKYKVMNDLHIKLLRDYKEFMKNLITKKPINK